MEANMDSNKSMEVFENAPVRKAVLQNALPAMAAMLMVLIYNIADTFFIGQTNDDLQVAAVSLATPVFLLFTAVGTPASVELPPSPGPWVKAKKNMPKQCVLFVCGAVSW